MANYKSKGKNSSIASAMLGGIVGLALALWVFNMIILAVAPNFYECNNASHTLNESLIEVHGLTNNGSIQCGIGNYAPVNVSNTTMGFFESSIVFINDLLPILGILGAFGILWAGLKKMGLF